MLGKYEWIASEKQFFGQTNTAYDFGGNDMKEVGRRLTKLQDTKDKLGKNVNTRAMNMMAKAEEKVRPPVEERCGGLPITQTFNGKHEKTGVIGSVLVIKLTLIKGERSDLVCVIVGSSSRESDVQLNLDGKR